MQAVAAILLDEPLAGDHENADLALAYLGRIFHQQFVAVAEGRQHGIARDGDDRIGPAHAARVSQKHILALIGIIQRRAGTGRSRQLVAPDARKG